MTPNALASVPSMMVMRSATPSRSAIPPAMRIRPRPHSGAIANVASSAVRIVQIVEIGCIREIPMADSVRLCWTLRPWRTRRPRHELFEAQEKKMSDEKSDSAMNDAWDRHGQKATVATRTPRTATSAVRSNRSRRGFSGQRRAFDTQVSLGASYQ